MLRQIAQSLVRQSRQMLPRHASRQMCTTPGAEHEEELFVDEEAPRASDFSRGPRGERCVNSVTLIGHLGTDPQLLTSNMNLEYTVVNMATNHRSKNQRTGEFHYVPSWHRVVVFNPNSAKYCARFMSKGDKVYVHGRLNYSDVQVPGTEVNVKKAAVIADEIFVLQRMKPFAWKSGGKVEDTPQMEDPQTEELGEDDEAERESRR